ncbi:hypothetical protein Pen02_08480 [Plantactinospora endophytica]|uniref:Uncharacterized protein n=1 Tax=Plantactinospora endophytica TaxID=673535 RepID=A0ABQ4DU04_9ACTN|nr:hypothetical protein Pen02_08480 [Plantactinospora endophytica]
MSAGALMTGRAPSDGSPGGPGCRERVYRDRRRIPCPARPPGLGLRRAQELGRLPWLAALFLRAFFFRDFFAMLTSVCLSVGGAGRHRRPPVCCSRGARARQSSHARLGRPAEAVRPARATGGWSPRPARHRRLVAAVPTPATVA